MSEEQIIRNLLRAMFKTREDIMYIYTTLKRPGFGISATIKDVERIIMDIDERIQTLHNEQISLTKYII